MKNFIAVCVLAGCTALLSNGFAATDAQKPLAEMQQEAKGAEQAQVMVLTGMIKKYEDGTALITADKVYPLLGGDFVTMIGQEVKITGKIVKEGDVENLVVSALQAKQQ